jgi:hypothetical protein
MTPDKGIHGSAGHSSTPAENASTEGGAQARSTPEQLPLGAEDVAALESRILRRIAARLTIAQGHQQVDRRSHVRRLKGDGGDAHERTADRRSIVRELGVSDHDSDPHDT